MEENESKVTQYLVPSNVSTRFEFIPGFGWYEFRVVLTALAIGSILFFLLGLFPKEIYVDDFDRQIDVTVNVNGETVTVDDEGVETLIDISTLRTESVPAINMIIRILFIIIPGVGAYFLVKKDPSNNMSLMYNWKSSIEYKQKQRLYIYKYNSGSEV